MPFLMQLVVSVGMQIAGYMLTGRPEKPKKPFLSDFKDPTTDSSRPVPAVFGTVMVSGLNILWKGDKDIKERDAKIPGAKK